MIRPVALSFQTENSLTRLPAVTELAAESLRTEATVRNGYASYRNDAQQLRTFPSRRSRQCRSRSNRTSEPAPVAVRAV